MSLRSGIGVVKLDVPLGTPMGGYADRVGGATGTADPLIVGAVTFFDGQRRAALVIADVICVNADAVTEIRKALIQKTLAHLDIVWVSATHTHCGPETGCGPGGGPTPPPWLDRLAEHACEAVERAIEAETPGPIGHATVEVSGVAGVRTLGLATPVPVDFLSLPGALIAVVPVHPTVLPATNNAVSADLPGALRRELTRRTGLPTLVFTGAAGDISTRPERRGQDQAELARLSTIVADHQPPSTMETDGSINVVSARISLERKEDEDVLADAEAEYRAALATGDAVTARIAETRLQGARIAAARPTVTTPVEVEIAVLAIGDLTLVGLPGEPFLELARQLRPAITLGYTNGYPGYLPTRQAYPDGGYEVLASVVVPGSAELIVDTATKLLKEVS